MRPCTLDKDSSPIESAGQQAAAELDHFDIAEHALIRTPKQICNDYKRHDVDAAIPKATLPTPIDDVVTKPPSLFAAAKLNREGGPDLILDNFCARAPKKMARLYHPSQPQPN